MEELTFNRMYRQRRDLAASRGEKFPSYQKARQRMIEAAGAAMCVGGAAPQEFWDRVFAASPDDRSEMDDRAIGREAMSAARSRQSLRGSVPCAICGEIVDVCRHASGGMLCRVCSSIASASDNDPYLLREIAAYLEKTD